MAHFQQTLKIDHLKKTASRLEVETLGLHRILVADSINEEGVKMFLDEGFTVDVQTEITRDQLKAVIKNYEAVIVRGRTRIDGEIMENGKKLKVIGRAGAGLDNIDAEAAKDKGIKVFNTPEAPSRAVAELTIGLMLSLVRQIPKADNALKDGKWLKKELMGFELRGKTLGILGFGNIGREVGRLAKSFGMKILIHSHDLIDPEVIKELEAREVSHEELLVESDVLTIHIPLSRETYHVIGRDELSLMKPEAYVVNTSRGGVIDEEALLDALKSGRLAGAALDVYEKEPPNIVELLTKDNLICTPHIGAQTEEAQKAASTILARKVINYLLAKGKCP